MGIVKKFGGVSGRKEEVKVVDGTSKIIPRAAVKNYTHLGSKSVKAISKDEAALNTKRLEYTSGSIAYAFNPDTTNLVSYPFVNNSTAYSGNGEPYGLETYGYWTPDEIDSEFNNNIWGIIGPGAACMKVDASPGTSGPNNWVGSLNKIWPKHCYWFKVTGSSATHKTISKQIIPTNYKTKFDGGWKWLAYPFSEHTNVSPNGYVPDGNSHDMIDWWLREGIVINQLQGQSTAAVYAGTVGNGQWAGSFQFKTGSGFLAYDHGGQGVRTGNLFHLMASTGSDSGESNTDDSGSENYYTGSTDECFGSGSSYVHTPIVNGHLVNGTGGGTFQTHASMETHYIMMRMRFSGSNSIASSSILNHDNSQMIIPNDWGNTASGSDIEIGLFNLSGSTGTYNQYDYPSGSVDDNSACFASVLFPGHSQGTLVADGNSPGWMFFHANLNYTTPSGSISGSEPAVSNYPTGSNQSSSIKVYSPLCDKVYMARLYEFQTPYNQTSFSISDIEGAKDVTNELTGSNDDMKQYTRHFIKLRNDVI